jgi:hypothetical protein
VCGNGRDDDCDTAVDEGCGTTGNDTCATARNISAGGTFTGSTTGYAHESHPPRACVPSDAEPANLGPDAYFFFDLAVASDVFIHAVPTDFDTVLYLGAACGGGELACNDDINPSGGTPGWMQESAIAARNLRPGRYYVTLDGYADYSYGAYSLAVNITPTDVEGDRCGSPVRIPMGGTSVSGRTCTFSHEYAGSCGATGSEAVYWFAVPETRTVTFSTCNLATTADTVLYLRSDCGGSGSPAELGCNDNTSCTTGLPTASGLTRSLARGVYFLFADSRASGSGTCDPFQVDVTGL